MADVTIIVPIYKVEKYLRACFESLLKQTSNRFTVLAVNDGSPDGCEEIIKEYVQKYPGKIAGIKKNNGGYGSVLQLAIKECKTPYFLVCDPDDTLKDNAVETLLRLAEISNADITIGAKNFVHEGDDAVIYDAAYNTKFTTLETNTVYNQGTSGFDNLFFVDPSPHAKLYRKELATDITFPEHVSYTDNMLFYLCLLKAKKVIYTDQALANYLVDRTGNTMTDISAKAMNGQIMVFKSILTQADRIRTDIPDMFYYRMFESFKFMLYQTRRIKSSLEDYEQVLNYLETYMDKLVEHQKPIQKEYKKYSKTAILERMRDMQLISPTQEHMAYTAMQKKMLKEFKGN